MLHVDTSYRLSRCGVNEFWRVSRTFWCCHSMGWGIAGVTTTVLELFEGTPFWVHVGFFALIAVMGTLYGLIMRWGYWRYGQSQPLPALVSALIGVVLVASFIMALILEVIVSVIYWLKADPNSIEAMAHGLLANWSELALLLALWTAIYVGVMQVREFQRRQLYTLRLENALQAAQINTLQGQLNPHFIFNGLNNIRALMLEDVDRARHMLTILADLLRSSLGRHQTEKIRLEQEMALVDDFVELASIQLEERLHYACHVEEAAQALLVPPMVVQMLVENAIKHRIACRPEGGTLNVSVGLQGPDVICTVSNPGAWSTGQTECGIGLHNIRERLALLYGQRASLVLDTQNEQVVARLQLPVEIA